MRPDALRALLILAGAGCAASIAAASPLAGSVQEPPPGAAPAPAAVVLVHGIWDSADAFSVMGARLTGAGFAVHAVSLTPNDGSVPLETLAAELSSFVEQRVGALPRFSMVGFSMGAIVARSYAQRMGGLARLDRLITISAPHHGSNTARFQDLPGTRQMRPGSEFLEDLERDEGTLAAVGFTSIWSPFDLMIRPPSSSHVDCAHEIVIPVLVHPWMLWDNRVIAAVIAALRD
jgi:triacylglycerol lipase